MISMSGRFCGKDASSSALLVVTVRKNGKFEGISETVEKAFEDEDRLADDKGRKLRISESRALAKGQGRGDESGYKLFRIKWAL